MSYVSIMDEYFRTLLENSEILKMHKKVFSSKTSDKNSTNSSVESDKIGLNNVVVVEERDNKNIAE